MFVSDYYIPDSVWKSVLGSRRGNHN